MSSTYSNPLLSALDAGLNANLSKSQWQLYAALVRQTLGYGKTSDDLTINRLHKLTQLRRDHAKQALFALADAGLIRLEKGYYGFLIHLTAPTSGQTPPNPSLHSPSFRSDLTNFRVNLTPKVGTYISKPNNKKPTHSTDRSNPSSQPSKQRMVDKFAHQSVGVGVSTLPKKPNKPKATKSEPSMPISEYCRGIFAGLIKAMSSELQQQALRITQVLSQAQQQLTLKVWVAMINQNKVKSNALALLGALVKAAKNNTLNTAILAKDSPNPAVNNASSTSASPKPDPHKAEALAKAQEAHSKRLMIEQHARLMGLSVAEYLQQFEGLSRVYQPSEVMA